MPARVRTTFLATLFMRVALAAGFLSAVADRFGIWGPPGSAGVAWGDWDSFLDYVAVLNWFAPAAFVPVLGWAATIAEVVLAIGLLIGWRPRLFAIGSGVLLLVFAATMTAALGIKPPLDYSVFGLAAGAFLLAATTDSNSAFNSVEPRAASSTTSPTEPGA